MKSSLFVFAFFFFVNYCRAQENNSVVINLKANTDSFSVAPFWLANRPIKANDTSNYGTSLYATDFVVKTDADSISIHFDPSKKPYTQTSWIRITSPTKSQWVTINYWDVYAEFSSEYIKANTGKVQFDIPEPYELANVLYALTHSSDKDENRIFKQSPYYKAVMDWFGPYRDHPMVKQLEFGNDEKDSRAYYNFRENSFCFKFEHDSLVRNNQYNIVFGNMKENLFLQLLPLINDFVKKSGFRKFYATNKQFYEKQVHDASTIMPVRKMWSWLENNFSNRYQSYRVIFSPLIKGSHSTQQFWWAESHGKWFAETAMFVAGPVLFENDPTLTRKQVEGLASGIVFTEIDHNYVNPVSEKHAGRIDSIFKNSGNWLLKEGDSQLYQSPAAVFNEYMTHAAYLLYAIDNYSPEDFKFIRAKREDLMVKKRKYIRFKEFSDALLALYAAKAKEKKLEDLYPAILDWAAHANFQN